MKKGNKEGQLTLSFGMIWAIILIIVFIAFAFYGINYFLKMQRVLDTGSFISELQEDVDNMWKSTTSSQEVSYSLSDKIEMVCFINSSATFKGEYREIGEEIKWAYTDAGNLVFYPIDSGEGLDTANINHLDMETILENNNPNCFDASDKLEFTLKKEYSNPLVLITDGTDNYLTEESVCELAQNGEENLCDALDFTFEEGYEEACCSEHDYCC